MAKFGFCLCLSVLTFGSVVLSAGYPTSYPYENEVIYVADMIQGTPDYTFEDATDPGGYTWAGHYQLTILGGDITDDNFPFCWHDTGAFMWIMVKVYGAPPLMPRDTWNCTMKGITLADADFTGVVDGKTICNVGECCKQLIGLEKYGDDQMAWHSWANDRSAAAMCGDFPHEDLYCIAVGGHMHLNCMGYLTGPTDRLVMFPCWDSFLFYWNSCPVYKNLYTPTYSLGQQEPKSYTDPMSPSEMMTWDGSYMYPDRVCNPYSYYFPDMGKDAGASPVGFPASDDSSSASLRKIFVAVGVVAMAV